MTALFLALALATASTVVVDTRGDVALEGREATPSAPFSLHTGESLALAEGARVVVLHHGQPVIVRGPVKLDVRTLGTTTDEPTPDARALDALFEVDVARAKPSARRAGDLRLVRPVPGGVVLRVPSFEWSCSGVCGDEEVSLYDFREDSVVWRGRGSGSALYAGPDLRSGAYAVQVSGREFAFTVASPAARDTAEKARAAALAAARALPPDDPAAVAIPATVLYQSGLSSEALWLIDAALAKNPDNAELQAMRVEFEQRAGIAR